MPPIHPKVKHLPAQLLPDSEYDKLYSFNQGLDSLDFSEGEWKGIRLKPGLSAEDVYRKLPSAPDFEYGGYLTKTRIRYVRCGKTFANTMSSKACTFHSHPTDLPGTEPDLPSAKDIYSFLKMKATASDHSGEGVDLGFRQNALDCSSDREIGCVGS